MLWNKFIITNTPEYPPSRPLLLCYSGTYSLQRENLHSNWADNNSPLGGSTGVAGVGGLKNTSTKYIMYYLESKTTSPCGHSSAGGELAFIPRIKIPRPGRGGLRQQDGEGWKKIYCPRRSTEQIHQITLPTLRVPPAMGGEFAPIRLKKPPDWVVCWF